MAKKNKLTGKFVVAYDTMCDGNLCTMTEDSKGKTVPVIYDSYDEAFKELFDDAHSMLSNRSAAELREYNKGVTKALVKEMGKTFKSGDVEAMKKFLQNHPECNDGDEWVEPADEFTMNRKTVFTAKGVKVTGTKLR